MAKQHQKIALLSIWWSPAQNSDFKSRSFLLVKLWSPRSHTAFIVEKKGLLIFLRETNSLLVASISARNSIMMIRIHSIKLIPLRISDISCSPSNGWLESACMLRVVQFVCGWSAEVLHIRGYTDREERTMRSRFGCRSKKFHNEIRKNPPNLLQHKANFLVAAALNHGNWYRANVQ